MPAIEPGRTAPNFSLPAIDGNNYTLAEERKTHRGGVVAAFYKKSCPVCQLTFPFLERIHKAYSGAAFEVLGIAQDEHPDAEAFAQEYHLTFPILVDEEPYPVSSSYGLTNVPSIFLIGPDGKVSQTMVGFDKQGLIDLSETIAQQTGKPASSVFTHADNVPDFKPG